MGDGWKRADITNIRKNLLLCSSSHFCIFTRRSQIKTTKDPTPPSSASWRCSTNYVCLYCQARLASNPHPTFHMTVTFDGLRRHGLASNQPGKSCCCCRARPLLPGIGRRADENSKWKLAVFKSQRLVRQMLLENFVTSSFQLFYFIPTSYR